MARVEGTAKGVLLRLPDNDHVCVDLVFSISSH